MRLRKSLLFSLLIIGALAAFSACTKDQSQPPSPFSLANCDTLSFANDIQPIFQSNCTFSNCHGNGSASAGNNWETHASITTTSSSSVEDLLKAIKHEPGYTPMPFMGNQLPDSTIKKIECWILSGAPNN